MRSTEKLAFRDALEDAGVDSDFIQHPKLRSTIQSTLDYSWVSGFEPMLIVLAQKYKGIAERLEQLPAGSPEGDALISNFNKSRLIMGRLIGIRPDMTVPEGKHGKLLNEGLSKLLGVRVTHYDAYMMMMGPLENLLNAIDKLVERRQASVSRYGIRKQAMNKVAFVQSIFREFGLSVWT